MIYWIHWITPNGLYHEYLMFNELIKKKEKKEERNLICKKIQ